MSTGNELPVDQNLTTEDDADKTLENPSGGTNEKDLGNLYETNTQEQDDRSTRLRTLTSPGQEQYENDVKKYTAKLIKYRTILDALINSFNSGEVENSDLKNFSDKLKKELLNYETSSEQFTGFLRRTRTEDSEREEIAQNMIYTSIVSKVRTILKDISERLEETRSRRSRTTSRHSHSSSASSILIRQRAKMEAAKARMEFANQEAEVMRIQAQIDEQELKTKAELLRKRSEAELSLNLIRKK